METLHSTLETLYHTQYNVKCTHHIVHSTNTVWYKHYTTKQTLHYSDIQYSIVQYITVLHNMVQFTKIHCSNV